MMSSDTSMARNAFSPSRNLESSDAGASNKRQRLPYSPAELASMEVNTIVEAEISHHLLTNVLIGVMFYVQLLGL
ncbi:hypothetical protein Hanom_Chr12g01087881 [Helianthus anomalus]